jgi:hypothetical protein
LIEKELEIPRDIDIGRERARYTKRQGDREIGRERGRYTKRQRDR